MHITTGTNFGVNLDQSDGQLGHARGPVGKQGRVSGST